MKHITPFLVFTALVLFPLAGNIKAEVPLLERVIDKTIQILPSSTPTPTPTILIKFKIPAREFQIIDTASGTPAPSATPAVTPAVITPTDTAVIGSTGETGVEEASEPAEIEAISAESSGTPMVKAGLTGRDYAVYGILLIIILALLWPKIKPWLHQKTG